MELEHVVEALIFASPDGVSAREMARVITTAAAPAKAQKAVADASLEQLESFDEPAEPLDDHTMMMLRYADVTEEQVTEAILNLVRNYQETGRAFTLIERPTGYRIAARPDYAPWVRQLFPEKKPTRLSQSALETLAIIAYRQPVTRSSIEAVRGVSVDGPMQTLLDRNVVRIAGRADLPGRPLLYETTDLFLEHFGIKTVDDLPNAAELRAVKLPEPEDEPAPKAGKGKKSAAGAVAEHEELPLDGSAPPVEAKPKRVKKEKAEPTQPATAEQHVIIEPAPKQTAPRGQEFVYEAPEEDDDESELPAEDAEADDSDAEDEAPDAAAEVTSDGTDEESDAVGDAEADTLDESTV
jgi:segregation and condensation protein B